MLALRFKNIALHLSSLELNLQSHSLGGLGFIVSSRPLSFFFELQNCFKLLSVSHKSLKACIGQHVDNISRIKFESRLKL